MEPATKIEGNPLNIGIIPSDESYRRQNDEKELSGVCIDKKGYLPIAFAEWDAG